MLVKQLIVSPQRTLWLTPLIAAFMAVGPRLIAAQEPTDDPEWPTDGDTDTSTEWWQTTSTTNWWETTTTTEWWESTATDWEETSTSTNWWETTETATSTDWWQSSSTDITATATTTLSTSTSDSLIPSTTATPTPSETPTDTDTANSSDGGGLSSRDKAIVGGVVGGVGGAILLGAIAFVLLRRHKKRRGQDVEEFTPHNENDELRTSWFPGGGKRQSMTEPLQRT